MSIFKIVKAPHDATHPYVVVSNRTIDNPSLSWEARGLLLYLLGKPDDWHVIVKDLERHSPAGSHKTRRIVKELERAGHLSRRRIRLENGGWYWISAVYERAVLPKRQNALATMPYIEYLNTPEWLQRRRDAIDRAGGACQSCGTDGPLQAHHRTYTRRGAELDNDLLVLCPECHAKVHGK